MAIIDVVQWHPNGNGETIYAYHFPNNNLSTYTQLIVYESQEAILFSKGQIIGKFGPGKHVLSTENLPILRNLYGIPFAGKNPFTAEVWFVNKVQPCNILWEINNFFIHDVDFNTTIPLRALGQYGLKVVNAEKFLVKIVGTKDQFTESDMTDQFNGEFSTKTKSLISQLMISQRIGYKNIAAYLDQISSSLKESLKPFWFEYGLELIKFYVSTIEVDDKTVKDAIIEQSSMSITGHTWQQSQMFGTVNSAIGGLSNGEGGLVGALVAMNMMGGMGSGVGNGMMFPQHNQPTFTPGQPALSNLQQQQGGPVSKMVYCSNCAKKFPSSSSFCPHCGNKYRPCPNCGTDNSEGARRCVSCGSTLKIGTKCPNCGSVLEPGCTFCGNCNCQVLTSDNCSQCGSTLPPNVKFCPHCGKKRT